MPACAPFRRSALAFAATTLGLLMTSAGSAQTSARASVPATPAAEYRAFPAFDTGVMDTTANPCDDFYRFACGNFSKLHPIPADQSSIGQFWNLMNVNTERLRGILEQYRTPTAPRTPNEQKIGDYYAACMDTEAINKRGLAPIQGLLGEIDRVTKPGLPYFSGELQRFGVTAFFSFGSMQSFKDSTQMVAVISQGGLGLPDRDYYTRTGEADKKLRAAYVEHVAKMLVLAGEPAGRAASDAKNILKFETALAEASLTNVEMRDPNAIWHPMTMQAFQRDLLGPVPFAPFFDAAHAPAFESLNVATPKFFPAMLRAIINTDLETLHAYLRFHLVSAYAGNLPTAFDDEDFHFEGTVLSGTTQQRARWKRCADGVDSELGEALGQLYVAKYFGPDSKAKTLEEVQDIEAAMDRDLDTLAWMGPDTRAKAKAKLHLVANKIGYPANWRDYSKLGIAPDDAFGNLQRARAFESDRQLSKIGQPIDRLEWDMTPPTVNADYNPSMNDINFPAGILQPAFYDPNADLAVNYGHIGGVIGHELTHGFDDEGSQFDGTGNLVDWWTAEDKQRFQAKTGCLVNQYGSYTVVDDLKINGKLTLGENTADNGGLLLAYMAYLDRAKKTGIDINAKTDGFTGPQRFYISWAQNWCDNMRPAEQRRHVLIDPHSPDKYRAIVPVINQPGFKDAFSCKAGSTMTPANTCRVW